jgi:hypothetical protein
MRKIRVLSVTFEPWQYRCALHMLRASKTCPRPGYAAEIVYFILSQMRNVTVEIVDGDRLLSAEVNITIVNSYTIAYV